MHRWKFSAFAAAAVCAALAGTDAAALALGPLSVQSHLGSPLLAEIEITEITPAELASLQTRIASPDVFRAHGMDFNPAVRGIQVQLQRLADGQAKLRLSSTMALEQPFLDLVLDASWSSGNLVRSYTVLLDPAPTPAPAANSVQAASPGAVTRSTRSSGNVRPPAVTAPTASTAPAAPTRPARRVRATVPAPASAPAVASAPANGPKARVRTGDTAGQLVRPYAGKGASLDQMLLALLRANPQAFVDNNVNRLKAGAVLTLPTTADAQRTTAAEARRIIAAQSSDFNAYRRRLAQKAPRARVESAQRSAAGAVQAQVEDASPSAAPLDKLTLSKQGAPEQAQAEEQLAQAKQSAAQEQRLQELQRNLSDLQEVSGGVTSAAPTIEVDAHSASTGPSAPDAPNTQASGLVVDGQNPPAPEPNASAEAGEQTPPAPDPVAPPAVAEEAPDAQALAKAAEAEKLPTPTPKKSAWSNPLLWTAGGAGLVAVALAGGLLWYRRKKTGAAAGQSILAAAASQKAAAAPPEPEPEQDEPRTDVDPIAEADVYLA
ncbi:MAG: hypothetical protein KIG95_04870, partial [Comamonas sp.]|nr:hypothetical protein [Comamonas sp.]